MAATEDAAAGQGVLPSTAGDGVTCAGKGGAAGRLGRHPMGFDYTSGNPELLETSYVLLCSIFATRYEDTKV